MFIDYNAISWIESKHNQYAHRHVGQDESWGEYQITRCVLKEYNQYHNMAYIGTDMYNKKLCFKVAYWYFMRRIPQLLRYYGTPDTLDNRLVAYNGGIRAAIHHHLSRITKRYIKQYHALEV